MENFKNSIPGEELKIPAATDETQEQVESKEQPIDTVVNQYVSKMTFNKEKNVWEMPDNIKELPQELQFAIVAEKRRRDAQAALASATAKAKEFEVKTQKLQELLTSKVELELTPEQKQELDDLKFEDPEAWRRKLNQFETEARQKVLEQLNQVTEEAKKANIIAQRQIYLQQFQEANPDVIINDEVIQNDIPLRITKKLEQGEVSFEQFLTEVANYLRANKVIKTEEAPEITNIGKVGGSHKPSKNAIDADIIQSYRQEIY